MRSPDLTPTQPLPLPEIQPPHSDSHIDWAAGYLALESAQEPLREKAMAGLLSAVELKLSEVAAENQLWTTVRAPQGADPNSLRHLYLYDPVEKNASFIVGNIGYLDHTGAKGGSYQLRTARASNKKLPNGGADLALPLGLDVTFDAATGKARDNYYLADPGRIHGAQVAVMRSVKVSYGLFEKADKLAAGEYDDKPGQNRAERKQNKARRRQVQAELDAAVAADRERQRL